MDYTHSKEFQVAGYEAMVVDGTEYGEVRQYGNFSFARIYESGHEVPYYQRKFFNTLSIYIALGMIILTFDLAAVAALAYFNRTLYHYDIANGEEMISGNLTTSGPANATHTNSFVPLTSSLVQEFPSPIYPTATPA